MNLRFEASREHLISFIEDESSEVIGLKEAFLHHVVNSTWSSDNNVDSTLKNLNVFSDGSTTDARVYFDAAELSDLLDDKRDLLRELTGWGDNKGLGSLLFEVDIL